MKINYVKNKNLEVTRKKLKKTFALANTFKDTKRTVNKQEIGASQVNTFVDEGDDVEADEDYLKRFSEVKEIKENTETDEDFSTSSESDFQEYDSEFDESL